MLELDLATISRTTPDDDVPRWLVIPALEDAAAVQVWATTLTDSLAPDFSPDGDHREHLQEIFSAAALRPRVDPFDQRLFYLPFGASSGLTVDLVVLPVGPGQQDRVAAHALLLGSLASAAEPVLDAEDQPVGLRHFHVIADEPQATSDDAKSACAPLTGVFWCVTRRLVGGVSADVVATAHSIDIELAALGLFAYSELVLGDELFE